MPVVTVGKEQLVLRNSEFLSGVEVLLWEVHL
jgi:hypothetical protein